MGLEIETPPTKQVFPAIRLATFVTADAAPTSDMTATFTGSGFSSDFRLLASATKSMSLGIMSSKPQYFRFVGLYESGSVFPSLDLSSAWADVFGDDPDVDRVFVKFFLLSRTSGERIEIGKLGNY